MDEHNINDESNCLNSDTLDINVQGEESPKCDSETSNSRKSQQKAKRIMNWKMNKKLKKQKMKEKKALSSQTNEKELIHGNIDLKLNDSSKSVAHSNDLNTENDNTNESGRISRDERKKQFLDLCKMSYTIVIDCDWENCHSDRPLTSLCQQIMFCYGFNKKHPNPVEIFVTSIGPRMISQLEKCNYQNWQAMTFTSDSYLSLNNFGIFDDKNKIKKKLVYLTSDSENVLTTLDSSCAYIIGGIVDRNSLKGATYKKAVSQGIQTAKLPIRENCNITGTHILTVNHVFEILLNYTKTNCWKTSIEMVIPQRKNHCLNNVNIDSTKF